MKEITPHTVYQTAYPAAMPVDTLRSDVFKDRVGDRVLVSRKFILALLLTIFLLGGMTYYASGYKFAFGFLKQSLMDLVYDTDKSSYIDTDTSLSESDVEAYAFDGDNAGIFTTISAGSHRSSLNVLSRSIKSISGKFNR